MNRKGLKIMSVIFAALIIITVIVSLIDNKKETGNFKSTLADLDRDEINKIDINLPGDRGTFTLRKTGADSWELISDNEIHSAEAGNITSLLSEATKIKVKQVVARDKENWEKYSVNDSLGTRIRMFNDDDLLSGLIVGRMTFSQSRNPYQRQPDAFTYVREEDEPTVYSTQGMLSMMVSRGLDYFRNATVVQASKNNLNRISFHYPADSSFVLSNPDSIWRVDNVEADSASTAQYLNALANHNNRSFASVSSADTSPALFEMVLEGDNMETISVKAWEGNTPDQYLVTSTQNEGTVFSMNQSQFQRLFKTREDFIK